MSEARALRTTFGATLVLCGALVATGLAVALPQFGLKGLIAGGAAAGAVALAVASGRPREVFLAAYILALTYNRQYFGLFIEVFGTTRGTGVYWTPADLMLLCLFGSAVLEGAIGRARGVAREREIATAPVLFFLAAAVLTTLMAERPDLAMTDTVRIAKFALLLAWLHRHMDRSLWLTAVAALAFSMMLQSVLGVAQVVLRAGDGLLSVVGVGAGLDIETAMFNRARGTLGHPNMLGPYLLMLAPAAFGVVLFSRQPLLRLIALAVTVATMAGLLATKSRAPGMLMLASLPLAVIVAVWLRALSPRLAIGAALCGLLVLGAALMPFLNDIIARFTEDFGASIDFRGEYNRAALLVFDESPLLGVGYGGSGTRMLELLPVLAFELRQILAQAETLDMRTAAPVHNLYLLILAEGGSLGLAGFLTLLGWSVWRGIRASLLTEGAIRGICVGLTVGILLQAVQQTVDFSLWVDPSWYTLALMIALLGTAHRIRPPLP